MRKEIGDYTLITGTAIDRTDGERKDAILALHTRDNFLGMSLLFDPLGSFDTIDIETKESATVVVTKYSYLKDARDDLNLYDDYTDGDSDLLSLDTFIPDDLKDLPHCSIYTVYWCGPDSAGEHLDGETLATFFNFDDQCSLRAEIEAILLARQLQAENEARFDGLCGGIGICCEYADGERRNVEW